MRRVAVVVSAIVAAFGGGPSAIAQTGQGQCYEGIGCISTAHVDRRALSQLSCQSLWEVRNRVYQDRGYCFHTDRALAVFSNEGCKFTREAEVPFNAFERANIAAIREAEGRKGCR